MVYILFLALQGCLLSLLLKFHLYLLNLMRTSKILVQYDLQVLTPEGIAVSTKDAYSGIRPHLPEIPLREVLSRPVEEWDGLLTNDFEETVFVNHPELAAIKRSLYDSGAAYASMSGSGSALFALYRK